MQIFYINLEHRLDRRAFMEEQFERLAIRAERVPAVTPDLLPPDMMSRYCDDRRDQWVSPVELACALSHRKCWQLIVERQLPGALILEDDAILASSLTRTLVRIREALVELDLIKIEASVLPLLVEAQSAGWLRRLFSYRYGAAGYALAHDGAMSLLRYAVHDVPVDDLLFSPHSPMARRIRVRQAVPALCITLDRSNGPNARPTEARSSIGAGGSDRATLLYKARHTPSPRMLRYAVTRLKQQVRESWGRAFGDARTATWQTIPFDEP